MSDRHAVWTFAPAILVTLFFIIVAVLLPKELDGDLALLAEEIFIFAVLVLAVVGWKKFAHAGWSRKGGYAWLWLAGPLWLAVLSPIGLAIPNLVADPGRVAIWSVTALLVGLNEETIFRGFLLSGLRRWMGPLGAALISSAAFGLLHSLNALSGADPIFLIGQMVVAFGTGMVLAAVTLRAGSVWPAVFLHFAGDAVGLTALGGFENAIQAAEAAPSMIIFGLITSVWGAVWIWVLARRERLAPAL